MDEIDSYLKVSELIITNSVDSEKVINEKENVRKKLHQYMNKLCGLLYDKGKLFIPIGKTINKIFRF